ncbi:MAG: chorismate synthase [Clostridiales bacterium]|jgi:chorismate synthase|nr:chorismate synthase [Clostridiales bacterium]
MTNKLRYLTAGESHGKALVAIIDGFPSGLKIDIEKLNTELQARQTTFGRGKRSEIECDTIQFLSGLRGTVTTGNPISFLIFNQDAWAELDCIKGDNNAKPIHRPRPGHADYAGCVKFDTIDARNISERASARETATRCAVGIICNQLLDRLGIKVYGAVKQIGKVSTTIDIKNIEQLSKKSTKILGCYSYVDSRLMVNQIDLAMQNNDSIGGKIVLIAKGMPAGIGSYTQYDKKLSVAICAQLTSLQTVKSVEFGMGDAVSYNFGSQVHDEILYDKSGEIVHKTNHAGGITGGMTNGNDIVVSCALKPIPTILKGMNTVNFATKTNQKNTYERSDICHVPAACVVAKNLLAFTLLQALIDHTGADTVEQIEWALS